MQCKCGCGVEIVAVGGHRQREFSTDSCRKRFSRQSGQTNPDKSNPDKLNLGEVEAIVDKTGIIPAFVVPSTPDKTDKIVDSSEIPRAEPFSSTPDKTVDLANCAHVRNAESSGRGSVINCGSWKPSCDLGSREYNRVSLPGDSDYGK